jgi:tyrosine-protein kinase Etk/Wzc
MKMQPTKEMSNGTVHEDSVDLKKVLQKFRPYWYIFLISLVLGLTGAYMLNTFRMPVYQASSTILIQEDRSAPFLRQADLFNTRSSVVNETAIMESLTLIDSVIIKMDVAVTYYEIERILGLKQEVRIIQEFTHQGEF